MYFNPDTHFRHIMRRYAPLTPASAPAELVNTIVTAFYSKPEVADFEGYSIPMLLDYIRRTHVYYLNTKLPEIGQTILFLHAETQSDQRLLVLLEMSFSLYFRKLDAHIRDEERYLLPYIEYLDQKTHHPSSSISAPASLGSYSLDIFQRTHTDTETDLAQMLTYIHDYCPTDTDKSPYRILTSQIESFQSDLNVHAFIEDEVLLPRARQLEEGRLP